MLTVRSRPLAESKADSLADYLPGLLSMMKIIWSRTRLPDRLLGRGMLAVDMIEILEFLVPIAGLLEMEAKGAPGMNLSTSCN